MSSDYHCTMMHVTRGKKSKNPPPRFDLAVRSPPVQFAGCGGGGRRPKGTNEYRSLLRGEGLFRRPHRPPFASLSLPKPLVPSGPRGVLIVPAAGAKGAAGPPSLFVSWVPSSVFEGEEEWVEAASAATASAPGVASSSPVDPRMRNLACAYSSSLCLRLLGCGFCWAPTPPAIPWAERLLGELCGLLRIFILGSGGRYWVCWPDS